MRKNVFILFAMAAFLTAALLVSCDTTPKPFDSSGQWEATVEGEEKNMIFDINYTFPGQFVFVANDLMGNISIDEGNRKIEIATTKDDFLKSFPPSYEKSKDGDLTVISYDVYTIKYAVITNDQIECTVYVETDEVATGENIMTVTMNRIKDPYEFVFNTPAEQGS